MAEFEIEYAENTVEWEKWHFEYIYGGFYVFPPDNVIKPMDELRQKFDPKSDGYCQAHISLSEPLPQPLTNELLTEIKDALRKIEPFEMFYDKLVTYPPYAGVCYEISPKDKFFELREKLHACSVFESCNLSRKEIPPHITIAEFGLTYEESEELRETLDGTVPVGSFLCDSIEYAIPNDDFYFERRLKIPLGKAK